MEAGQSDHDQHRHYLAERIAQAAEKAAIQAVGLNCGRRSTHGESRAAALAVLRELDRIYHETDSSFAQLDTAALADELEPGDTDA